MMKTTVMEMSMKIPRVRRCNQKQTNWKVKKMNYTIFYICLYPITGDPEKSLQQAAAVMILKTREKHKIPLSVMDSIVNDV